MPQFQFSPFIQTTEIFDTQQIQSLDIRGPEFKEFLVILTQSVNNIALALNDKDHGYYSKQHYPCGKQFFPVAGSDNNRGIARVTLPFTFTISPGLETIPHGIIFSAATRITYLYVIANDPVAQLAIPIPYVDVIGAGAANIQLNMDNTNVYIDTASNRLAYTDNYIVIEYTV